MFPKKNKNELLLSNIHQGHNFIRGVQKTELLHFLNGTNGSVDLLDQMTAKYTVSQKTRQWPLCLFYGILNSACLNAYLIHRDNMTTSSGKVNSRLDVLLILGEELMKPLMLQRLAIPTLRRSIRLTISKQLQIEIPCQQAAVTSERCALCTKSKDTKITIKCNDCKKFACKNHVFTLCYDCKK